MTRTRSRVILPLIPAAIAALGLVRPVLAQTPAGATAAGVQAEPGLSCARPANARQQAAADRLLISVRIAADGKMGNPVLIQSSGDGDLDAAVVACADGYRSEPTIVAGKPGEATWVMRYFCREGWCGFTAADPMVGRHVDCSRGVLGPVPKLAANAQTLLSYRIETDGGVGEVGVMQSSGAPRLDDAAVRCVSSYRYFPVYQNGQPARVDKTLAMRWQIR